MSLSLLPVSKQASIELPSTAWLGTQESLSAYFAALNFASATFGRGLTEDTGAEGADDGDFGDYSYMLKRYGNVAVLNLSGPIATNEAWWHKYAGATSYQAIANAAITAANDRSITKLLFRVDSGGGTANGIDDCASTLREIIATRIPIYTYVAGAMYSAAYWLGSLATRVYVNQLSGVGSIGCMAVHTSYHRYLKENFVDARVFRSDTNKAAGHEMEELTADHAKLIQDQINYLGLIFKQEVSLNRKLSVEAIERLGGNGSTLTGKQAVDTGFADEILSFERVITRLQEPGKIQLVA